MFETAEKSGSVIGNLTPTTTVLHMYETAVRNFLIAHRWTRCVASVHSLTHGVDQVTQPFFSEKRDRAQLHVRTTRYTFKVIQSNSNRRCPMGVIAHENK